jgi:hypothetical protein
LKQFLCTLLRSEGTKVLEELIFDVVLKRLQHTTDMSEKEKTQLIGCIRFQFLSFGRKKILDLLTINEEKLSQFEHEAQTFKVNRGLAKTIEIQNEVKQHDCMYTWRLGKKLVPCGQKVKKQRIPETFNAEVFHYPWNKLEIDLTLNTVNVVQQIQEYERFDSFTEEVKENPRSHINRRAKAPATRKRNAVTSQRKRKAVVEEPVYGVKWVVEDPQNEGKKTPPQKKRKVNAKDNVDLSLENQVANNATSAPFQNDFNF